MNDKIFDYNSTNYNNFLNEFKKTIIVFAGNFSENREYALTQFEAKTLGETKKVSLADYITASENESYKKLDKLFEELKAIDSLIIFKDAEQICGIYVGHTYSVVKYATPQEKYFIKKLNELNCPAILEFESENHLDKTIERVADAVVRFRVPSSKLKKLFFWLPQVRMNGSNLPSCRPA